MFCSFSLQKERDRLYEEGIDRSIAGTRKHGVSSSPPLVSSIHEKKTRLSLSTNLQRCRRRTRKQSFPSLCNSREKRERGDKKRKKERLLFYGILMKTTSSPTTPAIQLVEGGGVLALGNQGIHSFIRHLFSPSSSSTSLRLSSHLFSCRCMCGGGFQTKKRSGSEPGLFFGGTSPSVRKETEREKRRKERRVSLLHNESGRSTFISPKHSTQTDVPTDVSSLCFLIY